MFVRYGIPVTVYFVAFTKFTGIRFSWSLFGNKVAGQAYKLTEKF